MNRKIRSRRVCHFPSRRVCHHCAIIFQNSNSNRGRDSFIPKFVGSSEGFIHSKIRSSYSLKNCQLHSVFCTSSTSCLLAALLLLPIYPILFLLPAHLSNFVAAANFGSPVILPRLALSIAAPLLPISALL